MNTHQFWLRSLQDSCNKRKEQGQLTYDERVQNQFSGSMFPKQTQETEKTMQQINENEGPQQLDELPLLAPLAGMAARWGAKKLIGKAIKGTAALVGGSKQQQESFDTAVDILVESLVLHLEENIGRRMSTEELEDFISSNYTRIEESLEASLDIDELHESDLSDEDFAIAILEEAFKIFFKTDDQLDEMDKTDKTDKEYKQKEAPTGKKANPVTAYANPGDLHKGVGFDKPEQVTSSSYKAISADMFPKVTKPSNNRDPHRSGTEY